MKTIGEWLQINKKQFKFIDKNSFVERVIRLSDKKVFKSAQHLKNTTGYSVGIVKFFLDNIHVLLYVGSPETKEIKIPIDDVEKIIKQLEQEFKNENNRRVDS